MIGVILFFLGRGRSRSVRKSKRDDSRPGGRGSSPLGA